MVVHSNSARDAKYELMVYLAEQGLKDLDAIIAMKPEEAAEKFRGTNSQILDILTQYVKGTRKRIAAKGYFFPGVGDMKHASRNSTINGLRKYLAQKRPETTLHSLGLTRVDGRTKGKIIATPDDALDFLKGIK
jgi:hypothetical protein